MPGSLPTWQGQGDDRPPAIVRPTCASRAVSATPVAREPIVTRPVVLLCLLIFGNTFAVGAFPVLLPDIGRAAGVDDFALGVLAGAFGFARLASDLPAGLLITHHLRRALVMGALAVTAGVLCLGLGGPYELLVVGRVLSGVGHTLVMLSGITGVVRYARPRAHGFALNAYEMSGMLGILGGMVAAGFLPGHWPWNVTILMASVPQFLGLLLLPALMRAIPVDARSLAGRPLFSRGLDGDEAPPAGRGGRASRL